MNRHLLLAGVLSLSASSLSAQTFQVIAPSGHTYSVTVTAKTNSGRSAASGSTTSRYFYTPAAILPSTQTGNNYYVLFVGNNSSSGATPTNESIFLTQSADGYDGFTDPVAILGQSGTNICDMTAPRAIYDDNLGEWHVFVQAVIGTASSCPYPTGPAYIFEATGPSLSPGSLQWVMSSPGVAKPIIQSACVANAEQQGENPASQCNGVNDADGIGQEFQAFNIGKYTGTAGLSTSYPFMLNYYDYSYTGPGGGGELFGYLSPWSDGVNNWYFWYNTPSASLDKACGGYEVLWPDVILAHSLEESSNGDPSIAIGSDESCSASPTGRGLAFWSTLVPYYGSGYLSNIGIGPTNALYFNNTNSNIVDGTFPSAGTGIDDPKFARNVYGYLEPTSYSPTTWTSYIYYGVTDFGTWNGSTPGGFRVSQVTITEQ